MHSRMFEPAVHELPTILGRGSPARISSQPSSTLYSAGQQEYMLKIHHQDVFLYIVGVPV